MNPDVLFLASLLCFSEPYRQISCLQGRILRDGLIIGLHQQRCLGRRRFCQQSVVKG
jgi:hypothetical protein